MHFGGIVQLLMLLLWQHLQGLLILELPLEKEIGCYQLALL